MDSIKDFSEDIRVFRNMVQRSLSPKLYLLDKQLTRLRALPDKCDEEFAIKLFGKKHYKDPRAWEYIKAEKWDLIRLLAEFLSMFNKDGTPSLPDTDRKLYITSKCEERDAHRAELAQVTQDVTAFSERVRRDFVLDATLKYAEKKKFYALLDEKMCESDAVHLLSKSETHRFLLSIAEMEPPQKEAILESLSEYAGFSIREAVLAHDTDVVESYLTKLGDRYFPFVSEVSSLVYGLQDANTVYSTIEKCLEVCKSISTKYYIKSYNAAAALPVDLGAICLTKEDLSQKSLSLFTADEVDALHGIKKRANNTSGAQQNSPTATRGESNKTEETTRRPKQKRPVMLGDHFTDIKPKFMDYDIMSDIADTLCEAGYMEDTPDMKRLFIYRITGKGNPAPELLTQKIIWYLRASHPNELNGFLLEIGTGHKNYREYISKFFVFATGKNEQGEIQYNYNLVIEPPTQHKNKDIIDLLMQKRSLRILFE